MFVEIGEYESHYTRPTVIKIDNHDLWNLDHTLSLVIAPALKSFRDSVHSHPCLGKDRGIDVSCLNISTPERECDCFEYWKTLLDKMIFAFEELSGDMNKEMNMTREERKEYQANIEEGLQLFAKYFQSLWS